MIMSTFVCFYRNSRIHENQGISKTGWYLVSKQNNSINTLFYFLRQMTDAVRSHLIIKTISSEKD